MPNRQNTVKHDFAHLALDVVADSGENFATMAKDIAPDATADVKRSPPNRITELRKAMGMTIEDLAERSGVSVSYISRMANGGRNVAVKNLEKLASALGVKPQDLLRDTDPDERSGEEIADRIRYLREEVLSATQEEFAKHLNVERGAVGNWESGGGIKMDNLKKIADRFRVSTDWLANGRGEKPVPGDVVPGRVYVPFDDDQTPALADNAFAREFYKPKISGALPELDVGLGAGDGQVGEVLALPINGDAYSGHRVVAEWLFPEPFIRTEARASVNHTVVLPVVGDSMIPNYHYGDRVLVDLQQDTFTQDGVYAISDGQTEPRIKRLHYVFNSNPKRVRIISDNQAYGPEEHLLDDVKIIGRVCGIIARR